MDDVSDNMLKHKFCHALLILVYGMCMGRRYKLDLSEYKGASKAVVAILSVIGRIFPVKTLIHWYDAISKMERGQNKKHKRCYYSNCLFPDLGKIYQAKWFDHAVDLEVDGEKFPGPCGYHEALTMLYGDYMTPHRLRETESLFIVILNLSHYHTAKRERKIHDRKAAKSKIRLTPICGGYGLQSCRADDFEYDAFFWGISVFKKPYGC